MLSFQQCNISRYHMFLKSLSECAEVARLPASRAYCQALEAVLGAGEHTNTMMWVGAMRNCSHDLTGHGQLLKHGRVDTQERRHNRCS